MGSILLNTQKHTLDVQIHDFGKSALGVLVERRPPRSTGVGEEDVDIFSVLADFSDEAFDLGRFGDVGWHGNGFAVEGQGVQGGAGFLARRGFARGDEDFGAAGLD